MYIKEICEGHRVLFDGLWNGYDTKVSKLNARTRVSVYDGKELFVVIRRDFDGSVVFNYAAKKHVPKHVETIFRRALAIF